MKEKDYWEECISLGAEECGLRLSAEQIDCLAESVMSGHENYDMAFYTPPSSDRIYSIEKEYELKLKRLQTEFDAYRCNAESAVASRKEFRDEDECKKYTKELAEKHDLEYRPSISSETKHDYLD